VTATDPYRAIEAVFRIEQAKLIAGLARMLRDVGLAEEFAQDALIAALEHWPNSGIPERPGAWLMATAKRRAIDHLRRNQLRERKHEELGREIEVEATPDFDATLDDDIGDDLLRLIFTVCHPALSPEARVALTLRLVGGLTTEEIARAYLVPEPTIAQRLVRAKRTLAEKCVPFVIPLSVIGHENPMIYDWRCNGKKPVIARQIFTVDPRGFPVELWKEIAPAAQ
jgi:RNA polymerase sigma factor (sigma-70 family)